MAPFQKAHQQEHKPTFELAPIAAPHALDLLGNIGGIDRGEFTRAQKAALFHRPAVKVLVIVDGVPRRCWSPRLPDHAITTLRQRAAPEGFIPTTLRRGDCHLGAWIAAYDRR